MKVFFMRHKISLFLALLTALLPGSGCTFRPWGSSWQRTPPLAEISITPAFPSCLQSKKWKVIVLCSFMLLNLLFFPPFVEKAHADSYASLFTIAGGMSHSLAIKPDGTVVGWGHYYNGQTTVPAGLSDVVAVSAGRYHSLALKSDGTVVAWGSNSDGQCDVPAGLSDVKAIAAGRNHSLALKSDGTVVGWGENSFEQKDAPAGLSDVKAIAAGSTHSLALKSDGTVVAWGEQKDAPAGLSDVKAIAAGNTHSLALKTDGTVVAWGANPYGQSDVPAGLSDVKAIAAGDYHSLALKSDGTVVAWGDNGNDQVSVPAGLSNVEAIAGGGSHSLALKTDGTVVAWGANSYGQSNVPTELDFTKPAISFATDGNTSPAKTAQSKVTATDFGSGLSSLHYVWTQSTSEPMDGWQPFSNGQELTLNDPTANGNWYLHVRALDKAGIESYARTNAFVLDNMLPEITFGTNGNASPSKTAASTVTVTDEGSGVDENSLKYVWSDNPSKPDSGWQPFNNGQPLTLNDPTANGNWYLHIRALDKAGNESYARTNAFVLDNMLPEITFGTNGNASPSKTAASTVMVTDEGSGVDENSLKYVWSDNPSKPDSGWQPFNNGQPLTLDDPDANGDWYLHVRAKDKLGHESYARTNAFVLDNTLPVITLNGDNPMTIEAGSTFADPGATATDNHDGDLTNSIVVSGMVDSQTAGTYTLAYDVTDTAGNAALTVTRAVYVLTAEPPVIQFAPSGNSNPAKNAASTVTVTDNVSGVDENSLEYVWSDSFSEPTDGWQPFNNGQPLTLDDPSANGNWYLHIRAKDQLGNLSHVVSNAFIVDNTPPVISLMGDNPLYVPHDTDYIEPGAVATDNIDGDVSDSIEISGVVNTQIMGFYERHYTAIDRAGNSATVTRSVYVYDGSVPVIYLQGANPMYVEAGSTFVNPGATAMDKQDGDLTASIVVTGTVDPMTIGTYMLTYNVSDSAGNQAPTVTRAVYVQDTLPPELVLLGEAEMTLTYGSAFHDPGAQAMDSYYGDLSHLIIVDGSVDTTKAGTYILRYHVEDPSGNRAEEIRTVHVQQRPTPSDSGSDSSGSGFIDANGSLLKAEEIDLSQQLVILEVSPKETESADETQTVYVNVPVSILMDIADQNPDFQLEIQAPYGSYILPAALPSLIAGWDELLEENDWQAENISFKLTLTDKTEDADIRKALSAQLPSGELIGAVVHVHLEIVDARTGEALTEVNRFTEPIVRMIPISGEFTPESSAWGAFRYDEASGQFVFVPARLEQRDGRLYAVIRSKSNSVYVAVSNAVSFTDTEQHWGKAYVEQAAAKGLVHGTGDGKFAPDKVVTRAEFAAMLVRALGPIDSSMSRDPAYEDVQPGAWYYSEVAQAKELGLLDFVEDSRLLPNQPLTREEMARMAAAAVRLEMQSLPEKPASLADFRDQAAMDEAYLEDIQLMVTLGIMTGTGSAQFSPKGESTRTQAAIVLLKTLAAMCWID